MCEGAWVAAVCPRSKHANGLCSGAGPSVFSQRRVRFFPAPQDAIGIVCKAYRRSALCARHCVQGILCKALCARLTGGGGVAR